MRGTLKDLTSSSGGGCINPTSSCSVVGFDIELKLSNLNALSQLFISKSLATEIFMV